MQYPVNYRIVNAAMTRLNVRVKVWYGRAYLYYISIGIAASFGLIEIDRSEFVYHLRFERVWVSLDYVLVL